MGHSHHEGNILTFPIPCPTQRVHRSPSYSCLTCGYDGGEITERANYWKAEIAKQFPNLNLPAYYFMSGDDKARFEKVASAYMTPAQEADAITLEWTLSQASNPDFNSPQYFTPQLYPKVSHVAAPDPFAGLDVTQAVALVYSNPELIRNGLPSILDNVPGVRQLIKGADNYDGGWKDLFMAASGSHSYGVDWFKYRGIVRKSLSSTHFEEQLFAVGTLSVIEDVSSTTCSKINKILTSINISALTQDQKLYLINVIRPEPYYIAVCAKSAIPLLESAVSDLDIGGQAAAVLYKISSSEFIYDKIKSQKPVTASKVQSVRFLARNVLAGHFTAVKAGRLKPFAFSTNKAAKVLSSDITYWAERSEEKIDSGQHNTQSDRAALARLEADLKSAISSLDLDAISGIASAIGSYSGADAPPLSLVSLIEAALGNPDLEPVRFELEYALEDLKDQTS
jgi:hypothetical protein